MIAFPARPLLPANTFNVKRYEFNLLSMQVRLLRDSCHDQKHDPITTQDYYGLYGIFESTEFPWRGGEEVQSKSFPRQKFVPLVPDSEVEPKMRPWREMFRTCATA